MFQSNAILMGYCTYVMSKSTKSTAKRRQHSPEVIHSSIMQKRDLLMSICLVRACIIRNLILSATTLMVPMSDYKELQQLIKLKRESFPFNLCPSHYQSPFPRCPHVGCKLWMKCLVYKDRPRATGSWCHVKFPVSKPLCLHVFRNDDIASN